MKKTFTIFVLTMAILITSCIPPHIHCSKTGPSMLFSAGFESETVGGPPSSGTSYGLPGAHLGIQGSSSAVQVINSAVLGSKSLKITRGAPNATVVDAGVGNDGTAPYTTGVYYIDFRAHGQSIPKPPIAAMSISVRSAKDQAALALKLYDGSYYLAEGNSYVRLNGSYNANAAHVVHIELNLDARKYHICINGKVVASNKPLLVQDFTDLHSLHFRVAPTITEAFDSTYIVDDIRITK